jgi:YVTN family beta-propeller protein
MPRSALFSLVALLVASAPTAQHSQSSSVAANPARPSEIWAANRDNDSVSVVDTVLGQTVQEIDVGVWPRSIAFTPDGATAFVANQRGNVPVTKHFVTPFDGSEVRGSVSVIDVASRSVMTTLAPVGTEPYGLAVASNGRWFAVTGQRSGTLRIYSTQAPHGELARFQYDRDLNVIAAGKTVLDVDSNKDFVADLDEPRALVIRADLARIYVSHNLPGFVSVLDVTLDANGDAVALALAAKISLDTYGLDPVFNPVPVQDVKSQGQPRFADDLALSPDGSLALVPHLLHNVNHDVNFDFGTTLSGAFANRVYPAVSIVDAVSNTFAQPGDKSGRLEHELADPAAPAEHVPFGGQGRDVNGGILTIGASDAPLLGGSVTFAVTGSRVSDVHWLAWSWIPGNFAAPPFGTLLTNADIVTFMGGPSITLAVPNDASLDGEDFFFQGGVFDGFTGRLVGLTNGVRTILGASGFGAGNLGHRAGHPGRVLFDPTGDRALVLNRGSEDVFLYGIENGVFELLTAFPPRTDHVERGAFDATTPLGDLPLGMAIVDDPSTSNRDALLYVVNEASRTLSSLRVDWDTAVITQEKAQIPTLISADQMTLSERVGEELFEDASRAQTAGNFNNSCGSCHFEGGADGNVWQRGNGPRSTMPVYGGSLLTGLILWKGVRLNMGETGPMFGGENGGTSVLSDAEQQGLTDFHNIVPVPLNPNLDPVTGEYSALAALGKDLFFGTDDTGMNPSLRHAGCFACHPDSDVTSGQARGYTSDFVDPRLTSSDMLATLDPNCISLQENFVALNVRNVNSAVNVDNDMDGVPELDRNADGWVDIESYAVMNADGPGDFERDDLNGYLCPTDPTDPTSPPKTFLRGGTDFSVPTKLGAFSTGPYFHDHVAISLRTLLDPGSQQTHPVYGDPSFPAMTKFFNEFHDIRGNEIFVPGASKVQLTLQTLAHGSTFDADIEALLAYISSL